MSNCIFQPRPCSQPKCCSTRMQVLRRSYVISASLVLLPWIPLGHLQWNQTLKFRQAQHYLEDHKIHWWRILWKPWENISQAEDENTARKNDHKLFQNSEICYGLIADVNSKTKLKAILLSPKYKMLKNSVPFLRCSVNLSLAEVKIL